MAKDQEKLIRQISLISYLMAEGRPVSALEIKSEVEGYNEMSEDAFARRFYADRSELESFGIHFSTTAMGTGPDAPPTETYELRPEDYYLPAIEFSRGELEALRGALALLEGEFAYAEPLRLALDELGRGHGTEPALISAPGELQLTGMRLDERVSMRLTKIERGIARRKTVVFDYYSIEHDRVEERTVDPYHLVYRTGQYYLVGRCQRADDVRVFRLERMRSNVGYASKSEHDFEAPEGLELSDFAERAPWQLGECAGSARIYVSERIAWLVERSVGGYGELGPVRAADEAPRRGRVFETDYASAERLLGWLLPWRENAAVLAPASLRSGAKKALAEIRTRHTGEFETAKARRRRERASEPQNRRAGESTIRPERLARLLALAGMLVEVAEGEGVVSSALLRKRLSITNEELREDLDVLNIANFGGGTYVLYAEMAGGRVSVEAEAYGENFAKPARLMPLEAKALVAAIDLLGDHLPGSGLRSARKRIVQALGSDPAVDGGLVVAPSAADAPETVRLVNKAIGEERVLRIRYYKPNEDELTKREIEPYLLVGGPEGWYVASYDRRREAVRHFRLDRIKEAEFSGERFEASEEVAKLASIEGSWLAEGEAPTADFARVWVSPERARFESERRRVLEQLADGAAIVELPYGSREWLVREVLGGAGELVVLEPPEARAAVREAAGGRKAAAKEKVA